MTLAVNKWLTWISLAMKNVSVTYAPSSSAQPREGVETFASLVNRKMLVPSTSSDFFAVERHFLLQLMRPIVEKVPVDEGWYIAAHPDVAEAIERGTVKSARDHYILHGFYEHRPPYKIDVDEGWYLSAYPDVEEAIRRRDFPSAQAHFEISGFREGRLPFASFTLSRPRS